ncbi:MAG: DegT/DnrJ/EryC1/StrS family aminotransferase [Candidatus Aenigmatarchaeota archaeon]
MGIFREFPPTAGFSIKIKDLLLAFFKKTTKEENLENDFCKYLGTNYVRITNSGTVALYLILETLKEISSKKTVIIPAYTCPLVVLAIKKANLNIEICDIQKDNFNFDFCELEKLCSNRNDILAILAIHLGGIPLDFDYIKSIADKYNIFIIEDCAQALGALYKNKKVGTLGDFSFFSLARGKGLTIYEGGVIVTKNFNYGMIIDKKIKAFLKTKIFPEIFKIFELIGYAIFYRPVFFWFVFKFPQIFWKLQKKYIKAYGEEFSLDFPIHKVSNFRKKLGHILFLKLEKEIEKQRKKALHLIRGLEKLKGLTIIKEPIYAKATYPYLSVIFKNFSKEEILDKLDNLGLGVSWIYACSIVDYPYLKNFINYKDVPNAKNLANRVVTFSTNTFLSKKELDKVLEKVANVLK